MGALRFAELTGLTAAVSNESRSDSAVYDLAGRRLSHPVKGINIVGGRKVIVK